MARVADRQDLTTARLGSGPRGHKIERCPKCGRKGRMVRCLAPTSGGRPVPPFWMCDHVIEVKEAYGMRWASVIDHCRGPIVDGVDTVPPPKEA